MSSSVNISDQIPAVVSSFRPFHPQVSIHRDLIDTLQPIRAERSPRPRYIMHILYKLACSQPTVSRTIGTGTSWFCLRGEKRLNTNNCSHTNPSKSSQAINLIQRHVLWVYQKRQIISSVFRLLFQGTPFPTSPDAAWLDRGSERRQWTQSTHTRLHNSTSPHPPILKDNPDEDKGQTRKVWTLLNITGAVVLCKRR